MVSRSAKASIGVFISIVALISLLGGAIFVLHHQGRVELNADFEQVRDEDGFPSVNWAYWQSVNPDLIGWISIPGTKIDTAIVQAPVHNPQFYLNHDIWGDWNPWGTVYLSSECIAEGLTSPNAVIYGHNMGSFDRHQFADLENFINIDFANRHTEILLQTPTWKKRLQLDFVELVTGWEPVRKTTFINTSDFNLWYKERIHAALFCLTANSYVPQNNYCLVTCSYQYGNNERTVINASVHDNFPR